MKGAQIGCSDSSLDPDAGQHVWENTDLPLEDRVLALMQVMTTDEKISQLDAATQPTGAVNRLNISAFEGWNGTSPPFVQH